MPKAGIYIDGQANLERLLTVDRVLGNGWRAGLIDLRNALEKRILERTPLDTGALRGGIEVEADRASPPMWAGVSSLTKARGGFDYGQYLDVSSRPHYRSTRFAGQPTQGWFSRTLDEAQGQITAILARVERAIADGWR